MSILILKNKLTVTGLPYRKNPLADLPEWEGEWARVQRLRQESHSLTKGGHWREHPLLAVTIIA